MAALLARHEGVVPVESWGETALFYNPARRLPRGVYFAMLKRKDGANDRASALRRPGVFRLSLGTSQALFEARFGPPPPRPAKGCAVRRPWDFTALDRCTPHPVYGWMCWVAILNPSPASLACLLPLADAAHARAMAGYEQRLRRAA